MDSKQLEGFVLLRDGLAMAADGVNKLLETTEPKEELKPEKTAVPEKSFDLTYTKHTGAKLGEFQIADEKDSPTDLYKRALNILKQNKATIKDRYHGNGFVYGYWEYQNKIWRKKLKK